MDSSVSVAYKWATRHIKIPKAFELEHCWGSASQPMLTSQFCSLPTDNFQVRYSKTFCPTVAFSKSFILTLVSLIASSKQASAITPVQSTSRKTKFEYQSLLLTDKQSSLHNNKEEPFEARHQRGSASQTISSGWRLKIGNVSSHSAK